MSPESSQSQPTETPILANQTAKKEASAPDSAHQAHFLLPLSLWNALIEKILFCLFFIPSKKSLKGKSLTSKHSTRTKQKIIRPTYGNPLH